jgi:hypothetical protein
MKESDERAPGKLTELFTWESFNLGGDGSSTLNCCRGCTHGCRESEKLCEDREER